MIKKTIIAIGFSFILIIVTTCSSAKGFDTPRINVHLNEVIIVYEPSRPDDFDYLYYQIIDKNGNSIIEESTISEITYDATGSGWIDYDVCSSGICHYVIYPLPQVENNLPKRSNIHFSKISSDGVFEDVKITDFNDEHCWGPKGICDDVGNLYIIFTKSHSGDGIYFSKIDVNDNIIIDSKKIIGGPNGYSPIDLKCSDNELYMHITAPGENYYSNHLYIKLDFEGNTVINATPLEEAVEIPGHPVVSNDNSGLIYLGENGVVDSLNNAHILNTGTKPHDNSEQEDAILLYSKINQQGNQLFENITIAVYEMKSEDEYYPAMFDPQITIDSFDNLHIVWHLKDANSHSTIWYEKLDRNGNVLIPPKMIAGETEKKESASNFELILAIFLLIFIFVIMAIAFRKKKK